MNHSSGISATAGTDTQLEHHLVAELPGELRGARVLIVGDDTGVVARAARGRQADEVHEIDVPRREPEEGASASRSGVGVLHDIHGLYDVVVIVAMLHTLEQPGRLMRVIQGHVAKDGLVVLESLVLREGGKGVFRRAHGDEAVLVPTLDLMVDTYLAGFAPRWRRSPLDSGKKLRRYIFRCVLWRPIVMLVPGRSRSGKTTLVRQMLRSDATVLSTDRLLRRMSRDRVTQSPLYDLIREHFDVSRIDRLVDMLIERGLAEALGREIIAAVSLEDRFVVIEGYALQPEVVDSMCRDLSERAIVWKAERVLE